MPAQKIEKQIKEYALQLGFSHVGFCSVSEEEEVPHLTEWLEKNYHGKMKYMDNAARKSPANVSSGIRTMIVVGMNYRWPQNIGQDEQEAVISKYAWSKDYHEVMRPMLADLAAYLLRISPGGSAKVYVDTGPIVEKHWAQKAGIGWIGKHTNVISQKGSSWMFLGEVLTDIVLEPDAPATDHCGTCERCIEVCPTRAIIAPYVLDARLCISYLTIELRDSIPLELRPAIGNRIFGCDDCQDVCPWNRFAYVGDPRFTPRPDVLSASLIDYLRLSPAEFRSRFAGTNILRAKFRGFIRNCLVAAGNSRRPELIPEIRKHLESDDEMIREHAQWALEQYKS
jgi:epoxyqueuosine reductase